MSGLFKEKDKQKQKNQEPQWIESKAYKGPEEINEDHSYKETVFENPLFVEQKKEEQIKPEGIDRPPEPVEQKKLSKKQRKKLEKQRKKQVKAEMDKNIASAQLMIAQKKATDPSKMGKMEEALKEKRYGIVAQGMSNYTEETMERVAMVKQLEASDAKFKGIGQGECLKRDVTFLTANDKYKEFEKTKAVASDILLIKTELKTGKEEDKEKDKGRITAEEKEDAQKRLVPVYEAAVEGLRARMQKAGAMDAPAPTTVEECANLAFKMAEVYRFTQVTVSLGTAIKDLVKTEDRVFAAAVQDYLSRLTSAASNLESDRYIELHKAAKKEIADGTLTFAHSMKISQAKDDFNVTLEKVRELAERNKESDIKEGRERDKAYEAYLREVKTKEAKDKKKEDPTFNLDEELAKIEEQYKEGLKKAETSEEYRSAIILRELKEKNYMNAANKIGALDPLVKECDIRKRAVVELDPEKYEDRNSSLTRDVGFLTASPEYNTVEKTQKVLDDLIAYEEAMDEVSKQNARQKLLPVMESSVAFLRKQAEDIGVAKFDSPVCPEEIITRAFQLSALYRQVQVANYLKGALGDLVKAEDKAFLVAIQSYITGTVIQSAFAMDPGPTGIEKYRQTVDSGEASFQHYMKQANQAVGLE